MGLATDVLTTMRNGAADRAASELMAEVVQAVQRTGKKGSVTIKLDISMLKDGDTEMEVKATIKHSIPVADIPMGIFYPDEKGGLHRDDQRQLTIEGAIDLASRRMGGGASGNDL